MLESETETSSRKISETRASSPSRAFASMSKLITLDFPAGRRLSQLLPPKSVPPVQIPNKRSMSSRLSAGQMSFRRFSNPKKSNNPVSSGRSLLAGTLRARFGHESSHSNDDGATPLITKLDKYSMEELKEYRQVFNMFDTGKLFFCHENRNEAKDFRQKRGHWVG
uniref:Uncharacterized protein n=1 Tax=Panagrolaimus sp. JU765 TaxID=591449 RepID=A0AC34RLE1_9BILA